MTEYYLRKWFDPALRQKCVKVEDFSKIEEVIYAMENIRRNHNALGIAAPQVGDNRQILLAKIDYDIKTIINPKIIKSDGFSTYLEGCLSYPELTIPTIRKKHIEIEYQDREGYKKSGIFSGEDAAILQHEIDHLHGKLMFQFYKTIKFD